MDKVYVTVYHEERVFGGPEEGGWYYTQGDPIDGLAARCCGATWRDGNGDSWLEFDSNAHAQDCSARHAAEKYERQYVLGHHDDAYLSSFTRSTDGVSWLDSDDDAPNEHRGEIATSGTNRVVIQADPPKEYPTERPHYE